MTDIMTDIIEKVEIKYCGKCQIVKPLETGFYKAGVSYQKYCIPCHNTIRCKLYALNVGDKKKSKIIIDKPKIKTIRGFQALPEDIRSDILYDILIKINYKDISKKYNIKYTTLCAWKRKGLIN